MFSPYIYPTQNLKKKITVRCIIFSLRTDIGKQTITFFATSNNYNPIFHHKYKRYYGNLQLFLLKKKGKLGLEKPTSLSVLE